MIEREGLLMCSTKVEQLEIQELQSVLKFYMAAFTSRCLRGQISEGIELGRVVVRIARNIKSYSILLAALPRFIKFLMLQCRYKEILEMLRVLGNKVIIAL